MIFYLTSSSPASLELLEDEKHSKLEEFDGSVLYRVSQEISYDSSHVFVGFHSLPTIYLSKIGKTWILALITGYYTFGRIYSQIREYKWGNEAQLSY